MHTWKPPKHKEIYICIIIYKYYTPHRAQTHTQRQRDRKEESRKNKGERERWGEREIERER